MREHMHYSTEQRAHTYNSKLRDIVYSYSYSLYNIWIFVHFGTPYAPYVYGMKYAYGIIIIIIIVQENNIRHSS